MGTWTTPGQDEPKRPSLLSQTIIITNSASQTLHFHPSPAVSSLWKAKTTLPIVIFSATITDPYLFVHAIAENTSVDDILQPKYVPSIINSFFLTELETASNGAS
ncbi:hypothetical protein Ahy_A01g003050 [Arachis hypogaea]|uniref:Uncharacterized protein n=1 Tax=Arachis hypogaea TaxID=3818 RepID=A0A445ES37_ARAHY|nr:hypothetical protein Ahy_A01g003050 [Arachis hypogaea]